MTSAVSEAQDLPVSRLSKMAAPYNPRKISDHDLAALRRSLTTFGVVEPVVVNWRTPGKGWPERSKPTIVGGHQRVKAAEAENLDTLPVVWVDLDEAGEKQLNLALNRISGEWDEDILSNLLSELKDDGCDLELTGFEEHELTILMDGWSPDFDARSRAKEHKGIPVALIRVSCLHDDRARVLAVIHAAIEESEIENVEVTLA